MSEEFPLDDPVPGCGPVHGAGGVRAAVCGPEQKATEIRLLTGDGRARDLSGPAAETGHWRYALPSPDGRWVLAQWSGECEVPVAYLFRASGGPGRPVVAGGVESSAIGWSEDGRAVVGLWPGICGAADQRPGTYLLDPATGTRRWIHPAYQGALVVGTFAGGSRLEGVVLRALRELGLESCCQQPSHGSGGASAGMVFEGHDVAIEAVLHDNLRYMEPLDAGVLWFDCGSARYHLSDWGPSDSPVDHVPDRALAERAARRLVSRLYCTPGPTQFT